MRGLRVYSSYPQHDSRSSEWSLARKAILFGTRVCLPAVGVVRAFGDFGSRVLGPP